MSLSAPRWNRRHVIAGTVAGLAGLALDHSPWGTRRGWAGELVERRSLRVKSIRCTTMQVPFREIHRRSMERENPEWSYSEICDVELENGVHGYGESLLYYTWQAPTAEGVQRATGKNAASIMWDDTNGAGLQMALFDAVARSLDLPIHSLLGQQVHDTTPLSWWSIDMPPEDLVVECQFALQSGYNSYKTKGRPWFDLWQQLDRCAQELPDDFKIDMDFNETLMDAERAIPILERMAKYPQVDIIETPIPQRDITGNAAICGATTKKIAMHYGSPSPADTMRTHVCDGYLLNGGATRILQEASFLAQADMPFWLQLVGTGITAAWSLHLAAVCSHARWPAVNCHQLYADPIVREPIRVSEGVAKIPNEPGLGFDVNWDAVERYRIVKPTEQPDPERLIEVTWPSGKRLYIANTGSRNFMIRLAMLGKIPFYEPGAMTHLLPDDGSGRWRERYLKAKSDPFFE